jgi:hypothetical protein
MKVEEEIIPVAYLGAKRSEMERQTNQHTSHSRSRSTESFSRTAGIVDKSCVRRKVYSRPVVISRRRLRWGGVERQ